MGKRLVRLAVCFLLLVFGSIALAPTLLSTGWGKKILIAKLEKSYPYAISIDKLRLGWISSQQFAGVKVYEKNGRFSFQCDEISSSASLMKILFQKDLKELNIARPILSIELSKLSAHAQRSLPQPKKAALLPSISWTPSFLPVTAHVQATNGEFTLFRDKAPLVHYSDLKVDTKFSRASAPLRFDISGTSSEEQVKGTFHILGQMGDPQNLGITLSGSLKSFPMHGIDALMTLFKPEYQGLVLSAIGPSLDLSLQGTLSAEGFGFQLDARSSFLEALINTASKDNAIYLPSPGVINMTFTPDFAAKLAKLLPAFEGLSLKKNLKTALTIPQFSLPIKEKALDLSSLSFQAILESSPGSLLSRLTTQQIDLDAFKLNLSSSRLDQGLDVDLSLLARVDGLESHLAAQGKIGSLSLTQGGAPFTAKGAWQIEKLSLVLIEEMLKQKSKITPLLGQSLDAHGSFKFEEKALSFTLEATSPTFALSQASLTWKDELALTSSARLCFTPSKAFLNSLLPESLILKPGAALQVNLQELVLPLKSKMENLKLKADFAIENFTFDKVGELGSFTLNGATGNLEVATLRAIQLQAHLTPCNSKRESCGQLNISTKASLDLNQQELRADSVVAFSLDKQNSSNSLTATLNGKKLFDANPSWSLLVDGTDLPIAPLDKLFNRQAALTSLLGPSLNLHLQAEKEKIELKATSDNLNISGALTIKDKLITLAQEPLEIYFSMNAAGFAKLQSWLTTQKQIAPPFELAQPTILALTVSRLAIPISNTPTDWRDVQLALEGGVDKFAFLAKESGQQIKLDSLVLKLEKKERLSPLSVQLSSQVSTKQGVNGKTAEGKITCAGSLQENSDLNRPSLELNAEIEQFPTPIFDLIALLTDTSSIRPLFGDTLDAKAYARLDNGSGPVQLNLRSSNSRFSISGSVKEGVLSLSEPIHAQVKMTEELTRPLLKEVNPLSISSIVSSHPLTLEIQPDGFSLPFNDWKKIKLSHAKIELGQLTCENQGTFQITLGLLKSKQLAKDKQLELWFAPIELGIGGGIVNIERSEILVAETYEVATWGSLNLNDETVDMVLGLTSQCLNKAFSIKDLPPDYVMHIPMTGKMNDVQINTKAATAKIAALLIWQQQSDASSKGKGGLIPGAVGELIGRLATLPDRSAHTPPAKRPFPWDSRPKKESTETPNRKKSRVKKEDKPLKQLLKILR